MMRIVSLVLLAGLAAASPAEAEWQRYVVAPKSDVVTPVEVIATTGQVDAPNAMLHGGPTTLVSTPRPTPPAWPSGTTASASSFHAPNGGNSGQTPTTYDPANAIDGKTETFWNDDVAATYPAWLEISPPQPVTLSGITILSNSDGVPQDFTVQTWDGAAWQTLATVAGNSALEIPVAFDKPATVSRLRINVTKDQSSAKGEYTRINEVWPTVVTPHPPASITLDFGRNVVGFPELRFAGASADSPGVRVAFSETRQYLTDRSDFTRSDFSGGPGTDQYVPSRGPGTWLDTRGCQFNGHVCSDGLHGFRYMKISVDALPADAQYANPYGAVEVSGASLHFTGFLGTADTYKGWFESSDDALNRYWYEASYTNELTKDTFAPDNVDPRGADTPGLRGKLVLMDGAKRDRDPYDGDIAVSGPTEYLTHDSGEAVTNVLADLADHQRVDGYIPPASIVGYGLQLFEYPLYWAIDSWDYALYHGVDAYVKKYYPNVVALLNTWYPTVTDPSGMITKGLNATLGYGDYAFLSRSGQVTYYNALYVKALKDAAQWATAMGDTANAQLWSLRATEVSAAINAVMWDPTVNAYRDSTTSLTAHPQDANAWAVVAGVATGQRAHDALAYLSANTRTPYGNAFYDNSSVVPDGTSRVYAFTSYPELVARFETGDAAGALEEIGRLYGCMSGADPGTYWEGISAGCSMYEGAYTSAAHGWSTGVLPALTNELLGVRPTGPGFSSATIAPHPGHVAWARGQIPTPSGPITVSWQNQGTGASRAFALQATIPARTAATIALPSFGPATIVTLDGRRIRTSPIPGKPGSVAIALPRGTRHARLRVRGVVLGRHTD
jgi:hypothetical protein